MGFRTVMHVPRVRDYNEAVQRYMQTKPIRGREPEVRPLGERRDCDTYSIRTGENGDIELVLYKTPVITFHPNNKVTIRTDGYASQSTHQFISRILWGINASGFQGHTKLTFASGYVHMLAGEDTLTIQRSENGTWEPVTKAALFGHKMNRKAANNVRARYDEFRKYIKGIVSLRAESGENVKWIGHRYASSYISIPYSELFEALANDPKIIDSNTINGVVSISTGARLTAAAYHRGVTDTLGIKQRALMVSMFSSEQPEETKAEAFYKAFLLLAVGWRTVFLHRTRMDNVLLVDPEDVINTCDEVIMRVHAEEVLTRVEVPEGKLPNAKYLGWIKE